METRDTQPMPDPSREPRRAVHALRDLEESDRLRQLGAIVVHDLNNAMFALGGRLQLLRRSIDPANAGAVDGALETMRLLEAQLVALRNACPRDEPGETGCSAREAIDAALASAAAALPEEAELAGIAEAVARIDAGLEVDAAAEELASAIRQLVSLHRARGARRIAVTVEHVQSSRGAPLVRLSLEDHAGVPAELPTNPSLLGGSFRLADLPLAAAHRATREFGGKVEAAATERGLRTSLAFEVHAARGSAMNPPGSPAAASGRAFTSAQAQRPLRILIADDDAAVRAVLVAALEAGDHDVESIARPSDIAGRNDLSDFDAVIVDAGGGGLEALHAVRARGVDVPALVASGEFVATPKDPWTRFVLKPFGLDTLESTLLALSATRPRG